METTTSRYDGVFFFLHYILLSHSLHGGLTYTWVTCSSTLSGHPSSSKNILVARPMCCWFVLLNMGFPSKLFGETWEGYHVACLFVCLLVCLFVRLKGIFLALLFKYEVKVGQSINIMGWSTTSPILIALRVKMVQDSHVSYKCPQKLPRKWHVIYTLR